MLSIFLTAPEFVECGGRRTIGVIALRIAYGYQVMEECDYLVNLIAKAVRIFLRASSPGAFLVDYIPIRTYFQVGVLSMWKAMTLPFSQIRPRMGPWCRISEESS